MESFECTYFTWESLEVPPDCCCSDLVQHALECLTQQIPNSQRSQRSTHQQRSSSSSSSTTHQRSSTHQQTSPPPEDCWQNVFVGLTYVQIVSKFNPTLLVPHLDSLLPPILAAANNLRSTVCKNGLLTIAHLCRGITTQIASSPSSPTTTTTTTTSLLNPYLPSIFSCVLSKFASTDKKFVSDSAWLASSILTTRGVANEHTLHHLVHFAHQHKNNAQLMAKCSQLLTMALQSIIADDQQDEDDDDDDNNDNDDDDLSSTTIRQRPQQPHYRTNNTTTTNHHPRVFVPGLGGALATFLTERLPATKAAARHALADLIAVYGEPNVKFALLLHHPQGGGGDRDLFNIHHGPTRNALIDAIQHIIPSKKKTTPQLVQPRSRSVHEVSQQTRQIHRSTRRPPAGAGPRPLFQHPLLRQQHDDASDDPTTHTTHNRPRMMQKGIHHHDWTTGATLDRHL